MEPHSCNRRSVSLGFSDSPLNPVTAVFRVCRRKTPRPLEGVGLDLEALPEYVRSEGRCTVAPTFSWAFWAARLRHLGSNKRRHHRPAHVETKKTALAER